MLRRKTHREGRRGSCFIRKINKSLTMYHLRKGPKEEKEQEKGRLEKVTTERPARAKVLGREHSFYAQEQ